MKIGQIHGGSGAIQSAGQVVGYYWVEKTAPDTYIERIVTKKGQPFPFDVEITMDKPVFPPFSPQTPTDFVTWAASKLGVPAKDTERWEAVGWKGPQAF